MRTATSILLTISLLFALMGLVPCLGWLNWFGVPLAGMTTILSIIGLATDKDPITGANEGTTTYVLGLLLGIGAAVLGFLRCGAGGGVI